MEYEIKQLQEQIEKQIKTNINFYKKGELFLDDWRKGKDNLRELTDLLNQKLNLKHLQNEKSKFEKTVFVNSFGEATKREIATISYKKQQQKIEKHFLGRIK